MIEDLIHGWKELQDACPEYGEAEQYYDGSIDEAFSDPKVAQLVAQSGARYRFNFIKAVPNTLASRVELSGIQVPGSEVATKKIVEVWDANDMDVHFPDTILRAFEYGDSYLMVWPMVEVAEDLESASYADRELLKCGVEITYHSPKNTRVIYDAENERRKSFALNRWGIKVGQDDLWRVDLWYPDHIERWVSRSGGSLEEESGWEPFLEADQGDWEIPNEFGEIPFFHFRTEIPYGVPVHKNGYGAQDAINKMLITQLTTTDSHGWPQRYALIDSDSVLDDNTDGPDYVSDIDASNTSSAGIEPQGGTGSNVRLGPGTMAALTGMKEVGQFAAADPNVFMDPAEKYVQMLAILTETPITAFEQTGPAISGESRRIAEAPLVKRAERFKTMLTSPTAETAAFILKVLSVAFTSIEVSWDASQAATGLDDWQTIAVKQAAGVPQDQTLVEAGYEPEQVARWLNDESEAMDLSHRITLLGAIGDAVQKIGSGVALGVLSEQEASAAIGMVLKQATTMNPDPA